MGEEFHSGVCSGSWWSALRGGGGLDSPPLSAAAAASCSAAAAAAASDVGSFGWALEVMESKAGPSESAASGSAGSTLTFQGIPARALAADSAASAGFLMEPTAPAAGSDLGSPSLNWSRALIRSSRRSNGEGFYDLLNNDDLGSRSSPTYMYQKPNLESHQAGKDINQEYMMQPPDLYSGGVTASSSFHGVLFPGSTALSLQDLLDQDMKRHASAFSTCSTNFMPPAGFRSSSGECSTAHHQFLEMKQDQCSGDHLQFSNDSPLWNHATASDSARTAGFCSSVSMQTQLFTQQPAFERKPSRTSVTGKKPNSDGSVGDQSRPAMGRKGGEPALKKARIETPSPLPTFKVRKEKLGDRITALQQLVSPFGKTDTASVLHEAIEYIKVLHEQVGVLSTPYLKSGPPMQHHQASDKYKDGDAKKQDLRSRGLCLVPISITFPVVNEPTSADLWTPTFGGSYR